MPPIVILLPTYDDWESACILIPKLHEVLSDAATPVEYLLVDDGSVVPPPTEISIPGSPSPGVSVLRLRRNLGNQRAIAVGLAWVHLNMPCSAIAVMDSDGEDTPQGLKLLLDAFEKAGRTKMIFAARRRRTEGPMFRILYACYKILHRILTGRAIRAGNFSVMASGHLSRLVAVPELWSHYPAAVFKARLPQESVPADRGHRLAGSSSMNLTSLVMHGLSASAVFAEVVALRLLAATFGFAWLALVGLGVVVAIRFGTDLAIPGWATLSAGVLIIILFQAFLMASVFVLLTLHGRSSLGFLPIRDHVYFVDGVHRIHVRGST